MNTVTGYKEKTKYGDIENFEFINATDFSYQIPFVEKDQLSQISSKLCHKKTKEVKLAIVKL